MIPKIVHYIWVGGKEKPKDVVAYIDGWKKILPDFQFIEWNETNLDLKSNQFVKEAYILKKYAFVSDYVRLWVLYHYGGIYMDTDVELLKPLDAFLENKAFSGFEHTYVPTGLMGAEKNNLWIKELLDEYETRKFLLPNGTINIVPNLRYITNNCIKHGLKCDGNYQVLDNGVIMYPKEFFCPLSYDSKDNCQSENTHCIHHFQGSWRENPTLVTRIKLRCKYLIYYYILYNKIFN